MHSSLQGYLCIEKHPSKRFHLQNVVLRIFPARRQGKNAIFMCCVADNCLCYFCLTCPLFLFSFIVITIMTLCDLSGGIKCGRGTKARFEFWLCAGRQKKTIPTCLMFLSPQPGNPTRPIASVWGGLSSAVATARLWRLTVSWSHGVTFLWLRWCCETVSAMHDVVFAGLSQHCL